MGSIYKHLILAPCHREAPADRRETAGHRRGGPIKNRCPAHGEPGRLIMMAERMGFEPMVRCYPHTRLAGEHLRPTRSSLHVGVVAEGVGFEPTEVLPSTVFKTAAFDHSAIPPRD